MLVYLDEAYERRMREGHMTTVHDLREAHHGRSRPAGAVQDDDRNCHHGRVLADHVDHRYRHRYDETDRSLDGLRRGEFNHPDAGRHSGPLFHVATRSAPLRDSESCLVESFGRKP